MGGGGSRDLDVAAGGAGATGEGRLAGVATEGGCGCCGRQAAFAYVAAVEATDVAEWFSLERCTGCGVVRTVPPPEDLRPYYSTDLAATMTRPTSRWFAVLRRWRLGREVRRVIRQGDPGLTVDLGCGAGDFAAALRARGIEVVASDAAAEPVSALRRSGIGYARFDFDQYQFAPQLPRPPGTVVLRHVLEHVRSPIACLRRLRQEGARQLYIVVPNAGSRECRWLGTAWYLWDPPRHLWHFDPATLARVCTEAGFDVVAHGLETAPILLPSLYRHLRRRGWPRGLFERFGPTSSLTAVTAPLNLLLAGNVTWVVARARTIVSARGERSASIRNPRGSATSRCS